MNAATIKRLHVERIRAKCDCRRAFHAQRNGLYMPHRGEGHTRAKLTERKVRSIRKRHAAGEGIGAIARRYGVSGPCISQIVHNASWRHIS